MPRVHHLNIPLRVFSAPSSQLSTAFVVVCFALLFGISVPTSISSWSDYHSSYKPWEKHTCEIVGSTSNSQSLCENDERVPVVMVVDTQSGRLPAYEEQNKLECSSKKYGDGTKPNCWWDGKARYVLLKEGSYSNAERSRRKMRAVLTSLTTAVFGLVMLHFLRRTVISLRRPQRPPSRTTPSGREVRGVPMAAGANSSNGGGGMPRSGRHPLSVRDARTVVLALHDTESLETDDVCPICLEDYNATNPKRRTRLPCSHLFHEDCALLMLQKGFPSCPCCMYDLSADVEKLRQPRRSRRTSSTCDSQRCLSDASNEDSFDQRRSSHNSANVQTRGERPTHDDTTI